jgi:hypothetical protein
MVIAHTVVFGLKAGTSYMTVTEDLDGDIRKGAAVQVITVDGTG